MKKKNYYLTLVVTILVIISVIWLATSCAPIKTMVTVTCPEYPEYTHDMDSSDFKTWNHEVCPKLTERDREIMQRKGK